VVSDPVAMADQVKVEVKQAAQIIALFYTELISQGVWQSDAADLTRDYAEAMWASQAAEDE
jgi:hypothetical protein